MTHLYKSLYAITLTLVLSGSAPARVITVSSLSDLQRAIDTAMPGDVVRLSNGVYTAQEDIVINRQGTKGQPIIITSETPGGAEITGSGGFRISRPASYITIRGFRFTHAAGRAKSDSGTRFCRWTENFFRTPGKGDYLLINGDDHEVDYNTFLDKDSLGKFIAIRGEGSQIAQRIWIHHNYFYNFTNQGGANGAEALQFGLSGFSLSSSNSVVEFNLFEKCNGENELISVKASEVTLRYNTIRDCPAQFTLRHGNRCVVYGNYFFNTPGIRIFGDDHIIHSNYFENCSMAINVGNGGGEVADGAPLVSHDRPDRVLVVFNTMVNNKRNIVQTLRPKIGIGATYITVANNIIQGGGPAAEISGPFTHATWKGNIIWHTTGRGDMPQDGFREIDPQLERNESDPYHLAKNSPAIDQVAASFPIISVDMEGQPRRSTLDIGADEVSEESILGRVMTPGSVGCPTAWKVKEVEHER